MTSSWMLALAICAAVVSSDSPMSTKLTAADAAAGDLFGRSVAVSADTVLVGAPLDDGTGSWTRQARLTASDAAPGDQFGEAVAIAGNPGGAADERARDRPETPVTLVAGAPGDDDAGDSSGSAHVFVRRGAIWSHH